jgi:predicted ATPase/DNA-binding SARP family transcriptional activator
MSALTIQLLGAPRVDRDGAPVRFELRKATALLAYLAVSRRPHTRDALATLFWPELDQSSARARLRRVLADLRKGVGKEWIEADRETIGLNLDAAICIDVDRFRALLRQAGAHGHADGGPCATCAGLLEEAARLCTDDFMAGFTLRDSPAFDEWQFFAAEGLRDDLARVLERLTLWHSAQGTCDAAIAMARRWVALDPLHEPAQRALMRAYAQGGQRSAALRQYQDCARTLDRELGVAPSPKTAALYERIRTGDLGPTEATGTDVVASAPRRHDNLPWQPTPLVGRERELAALRGRLLDPACRLLTLLGPGGSGKTRLAIEGASLMSDDFEHGVSFVSLAGWEPSRSPVPALVKAMGLSLLDQHDPEEQLLNYLSDLQMLLVLDNFEHLLARNESEGTDATGLVTAILQAAPGVKLLVTSRAALRVQGEQTYRVAGLPYPEPRESAQQDSAGGPREDGSALDLFVESARRVSSDFTLTADNSGDVARICRQVSGLPLGILLAAAWVRGLEPNQIADQLEQGLDLLETNLRDVPARQRSVRAVFDYSWRLLTERERSVMAALSVFQGGFTGQAAGAVAGATLHDLLGLVDQSLVEPVEGGRYQLHELLRQCAAERLRDSTNEQSVRDRHCHYYSTALEAWSEEIVGLRQREVLLEMDLDIGNARAAWDWAAEKDDAARLGRSADAMYEYATRRSRSAEGEEVFRRATDRSRTDPEDTFRTTVLLTLRGYQGALALNAGHVDDARAVVADGLAMAAAARAGPPALTSPEAFLWWVRGHLGRVAGRGESEQAFRRSIDLYRAAGNSRGVAQALCGLARVTFVAAGYQDATGLLEESVAIYREIDDPLGLAEALLVLGMTHACAGNPEASETAAREGLAVRQQIGDPIAIAEGLTGLAWAHVWAGRWTESLPLVAKRVSIYQDRGLADAYGMHWVGWNQTNLGLYARARKNEMAALRTAEEKGQVYTVAAAQAALAQIDVADGMPDRARNLLLQSISHYEATGYRDWAERARCNLPYTARGREAAERARNDLCRGLTWAADRGSLPVLVEVLPASAFVLLGCGDVEAAIEVYELASTLPAVANSQWFEHVVGAPIMAAAASLPPAAVEGARERGRNRDVQATLAELLAQWR